jgi:hypothetical protein
VLGDSVVLGARGAIRDAVPGARVDAEVARMPGAFIGRIKKLRARDKLADVVVLHPATNGVLPEAMMREMLDLLAEYPRVVVVNAQMPRNWRKPNNAVLSKVVPDYPNAVLVDWFAASADQPGLVRFRRDSLESNRCPTVRRLDQRGGRTSVASHRPVLGLTASRINPRR